ncbi:Uncharacterised protein [Mycobacteroides abscessus subsp. abscessus]|nr:Uncharacterised protein [Mycobacteroides abscessus subsp. abscessus]
MRWATTSITYSAEPVRMTVIRNGASVARSNAVPYSRCASTASRSSCAVPPRSVTSCSIHRACRSLCSTATGWPSAPAWTVVRSAA